MRQRGICGGRRPHCSGGLELRLSAPQASQGSLILAEVQSKKALREVTGKWIDRNVYFWKVKCGASAAPALPELTAAKHCWAWTWKSPPGTYDLSVDGDDRSMARRRMQRKTMVDGRKICDGKAHCCENNLWSRTSSKPVVPWRSRRNCANCSTPSRLRNYGRDHFASRWTGVTKGTNFGKRRILNGQPRSPHTGADFPALTGTPVHATQSGRVVLAEELYFSGNTVIVDHGLGVYSLYGHLSATDVSAGDNVKAGTYFGKSRRDGARYRAASALGNHRKQGTSKPGANGQPASSESAFRNKRSGKESHAACMQFLVKQSKQNKKVRVQRYCNGFEFVVPFAYCPRGSCVRRVGA